jgi:hypothetical protein
MSGRIGLVSAIGLLGVFLLGCGDLDQGSSLGLVDANESRAVLEYAEKWSGWEILPSSIWTAELAGGAMSRLKSSRVQAGLQASGDYYVAEVPTDSGDGSRIVAGQFSADDEWTVYSGSVRLTGRIYPQVALDGTRAVYRTPGGLVVYDLAQRSVAKTIGLATPPVELLAVGGSYAAIMLDTVSGRVLLVNLEDGTSFEPPDGPEGLQAAFWDAAISDTELVTGAYSPEADLRAAILALDLTSRTWRVVADYGRSPSWGLLGWSVAVQGADDDVVVVLQVGSPWQRALELVDRTTGTRTQIASGALDAPSCALLRNGRVYWLDTRQGAIQVYNVATGLPGTYLLDLPEGWKF